MLAWLLGGALQVVLHSNRLSSCVPHVAQVQLERTLKASGPAIFPFLWWFFHSPPYL